MSDIADRVKKIVVEHLGVEEDKVTENASFIDDMGADFVDTVELVMGLEESRLEIPDDAAETIQTFGDAVKFYRKRLRSDPLAGLQGTFGCLLRLGCARGSALLILHLGLVAAFCPH